MGMIRFRIPDSLLRLPSGDFASLNSSFSVNLGEILVISGPNGCGKSTLLGVLAGLGREGRRVIVEEDGEEISADRWARRKGNLSYLFQANPAPDCLRIGEFLRLARLPCLPKPFSDWATKALLNPATFIGELSGGERQFLGVAVALGQGARTYFLDEPLRHLDEAHVSLVLGCITSLACNGSRLVIVQHPAMITVEALRAEGVPTEIYFLGESCS